MNAPNQPHILVIDDDSAMRKLIADYLVENELRATAVATGAEMEQALAQHTIDLVVLDLRLAGEDGMQLARKLREESATPIVMVTGRQDEADRVMGLELGADDYVIKPFSPRELLARIRAVLRRYRVAQAIQPARDDRRRGLPVFRLGTEPAQPQADRPRRPARRVDERRVQPAAGVLFGAVPDPGARAASRSDAPARRGRGLRPLD